MEAREEEDIQVRLKDLQSAGVAFAKWQVIGVGRKASSLNGTAEVGRSESK